MTSARKFPNDVRAAKAARQFALEQLAGYAPEVLEVVELLVSELATNSVRHTDSGFEVRVSSGPRRIRVSVTDSGAGQPVERAPDPTAASGRGLALVKMLSSASGVRPSRAAAGGKTVWFVLDVADHRYQPALAARASAGSSAASGESEARRPKGTAPRDEPSLRAPYVQFFVTQAFSAASAALSFGCSNTATADSSAAAWDAVGVLPNS
jgi:anti-sigma regulatory factor (Ser/Thr protein kinase)